VIKQLFEKNKNTYGSPRVAILMRKKAKPKEGLK